MIIFMRIEKLLNMDNTFFCGKGYHHQPDAPDAASCPLLYKPHKYYLRICEVNMWRMRRTVYSEVKKEETTF